MHVQKSYHLIIKVWLKWYNCLNVDGDLEVQRCLFHDKQLLESKNKGYLWDKVSWHYTSMPMAQDNHFIRVVNIMEWKVHIDQSQQKRALFDRKGQNGVLD